MFQDYKDLLSAFHAHGVKYLIVGGYAVSFHAQPRFTNDLDFFIKADPARRRKKQSAICPVPALLLAFALLGYRAGQHRVYGETASRALQ